MDRKNVTIATLTWARNKEEENLLQQSLKQLAEFGLPVFITDGGSSESFLNFLQSFSHFKILQPTKGVWPQARNSLMEASKLNASFIIYTEPDKIEFFAKHLSNMLRQIHVNEQTGIVLASRSPKGFESFPSFQQTTETTINGCCEELIEKKCDYTYGPFLLNKKLIPYLNDLPSTIGWGWRPYAFQIAKRLGYDIDAYIGDFYCPLEQRQDDLQERIYRMKQLSQNIEGLVLSASANLK